VKSVDLTLDNVVGALGVFVDVAGGVFKLGNEFFDCTGILLERLGHYLTQLQTTFYDSHAQLTPRPHPL
jgi:hypothetical protein